MLADATNRPPGQNSPFSVLETMGKQMMKVRKRMVVLATILISSGVVTGVTAVEVVVPETASSGLSVPHIERIEGIDVSRNQGNIDWGKIPSEN